MPEEPSIQTSVSMWYPREEQITVRPHSQPGVGSMNETRWYLALSRRIDICVGAYDENLDADLAAMRKLAAAAAEIADLLAERAAAAVTA